MASKNTQKRLRPHAEGSYVGGVESFRPSIKEIKVSVVEIRSKKKKKKKKSSDEQTQPEEAVWYNVKYTANLDIEGGSDNRINVWSTKGVWDDDNPSSFMMSRVREKLVNVAEDKGIDLLRGVLV